MAKTRKHTSRYKWLLALLTILLVGILTARYLYNRYFEVTFTPASYEESADALDNPYYGWYHIYGYMLKDEAAPDLTDVITHATGNHDTRLVLLEINLKEFKDSDLSESALSMLDSILSIWSDTDKQLIVRFLYDWDGKAMETEPSDIETILTHMTQTGEIVNRYASHIYLMQGIFVGNCGEMNNSAYMDDASMITLMQHLAKVTNPSIFLSVRTPAHLRTIRGTLTPLSSSDAFQETLDARLGLFNDGMLGSGNDLGTYGDDSLADATDTSAKGTRPEEIAFQNQICQFVPNGGEVVLDNSYNDFTNAIRDLSAMHVSYLDCDYDRAVLDKWEQSTYEGSDVFSGMNGYDYISRHLGYRYLITDASVTFQTFSDETATLTLSMANTGFANCYKQYDMTILLDNKESHTTYTIACDSDNRYWNSNTTTDITLPLAIRDYDMGTYDIYLSLTDATTGEAIALANTIPASADGYAIGSLTIGK